MTPDDLNRDRAIIDAATPGPWEAVDDTQRGIQGIKILLTAVRGPGGENLMRDTGYPSSLCTFIAAARTRWPAALDEIERQADTIRRLREALDGHAWDLRKIGAHTFAARIDALLAETAPKEGTTSPPGTAAPRKPLDSRSTTAEDLRMTTDQKTISDQLRAAVRGDARSQAAIAREAGIPAPNLSDWLAGRATLTLDTVDRLAAVLGGSLVFAGKKRSKKLSRKSAKSS